MKKPQCRKMEINDNHFMQAISCPLKLVHLKDKVDSYPAGLLFRHRNKLRLRDAITCRFRYVRFTSDDTASAEIETGKWLEEKEIVICGAVLRWENMVCRIPILLKKEDHFSVLQIHGKLRKRAENHEITTAGKNRSTAGYLLKAAYRVELLNRIFPGSRVDVKFCFPDKQYRSSVDGLMQKLSRNGVRDAELIKEVESLFAEVDATKGVEEVLCSIPAKISHSYFEGDTMAQALKKINRVIQKGFDQKEVSIHNGCKYCEFRKTEESEKKGCWEQFFAGEGLRNPGRHVFELIGHGNEYNLERGLHYQEQISEGNNTDTFEEVQASGGALVSIHQRRALQLIKSSGGEVPRIWLKPEARMLDTLSFPLHFVDFEAATYPIPMNRGGRAYDPVYFQFSCHTLHQDGSLHHSEWLDGAEHPGYPHRNFVLELASVPDIFSGTIIQYSPFEKQGINYLLGEFQKNSMLYKEEIELLEKLIGDTGHTSEQRFFDLSNTVRDFYFNTNLEGSLGLKQVLKSILLFERNRDKTAGTNTESDHEFELLNGVRISGETDPYLQIGLSGFQIGDGEDAMQAYLAMKNNAVTEAEKKWIPGLLRKYCALDSYALYMIYRHLNQLSAGIENDEDLVIF